MVLSAFGSIVAASSLVFNVHFAVIGNEIQYCSVSVKTFHDFHDHD